MILIQKAAVKDAAIIAETGRVTFLESHGHSAAAADIESYISKVYTEEALKTALEKPGNIFHLICFDGQVAGYSQIILSAPNELIPAANITNLGRLYLLERFYDMKLGRELLAFNINISEQSGQQGMWLCTWTENKRAIAFYRKAGFKIIGATDFKISGTHSNPNHIMYLEYNKPG